MNRDIKKLKRILEKGKMDQELREAIEATILAIDKNDIGLVFDLTTVKSFISGCMTHDRPFKEDSRYNTRILGKDIYQYLDEMHFDYAVKSEKMPSGMSAICVDNHNLTVKTISGGKQDNTDHPVVKKIKAESDYIWNESREKYDSKRSSLTV